MAADSKAKYLRDAEKYILQGKTQQAIGEYLKVIKCDPEDVLILNTIGDLYLRQGKISEANKLFSQVAENYVRNNFFVKAIAVFKKILKADPLNLEINLTVASLYAKQGLTVDARDQYRRVAELFEKEGKSQESLEAYEKVVELNPSDAAVQLKLAEMNFSDGATEKALLNLAGAARAQVKSGDLAGAMESFRRAVQIDPLDIELMKGFLDCALKLGQVTPVLDELEKSLVMEPDNVEMRRLLGRVHLANKDPEAAAEIFQGVISKNESSYGDFFDLARAFMELSDYDQASSCLDPIVPILITRRETERAVDVYNLILQSCPSHVLTMTKLAAIYSATNDQFRHIEMLDKIAEFYLNGQNPSQALDYLEKILSLDPESEKHQRLHRKAFVEVFPESDYVSPVPAPEVRKESVSFPPAGTEVQGGETAPIMVEVDLLLNYGMKEKALALLRSLESRNPSDKQVRIRILSLLKEEKMDKEAAEQCLLLSVLHGKANDEEAAQSYLAEASRLDPKLQMGKSELEDFARRNGIVLESHGADPGSEVDLSGDLLDIFFKGEDETVDSEEPEPQLRPEEAEGYVPESRTKGDFQSVQEKLQEVDFYIRLGFHEEARAQLDQIAKGSALDPEIDLRYQQLDELVQQTIHNAESAPGGDGSVEAVQETPLAGEDIFRGLESDQILDSLTGDGFTTDLPSSEAQSELSTGSTPAAEDTECLPGQPPLAADRTKSDFGGNALFADVIEEVTATNVDGEFSQKDFETHFGLGTAFREMDLMDEAVAEFQKALKLLDPARNPREMVQCCGMLSTCFLDKGMPRSAVRWCQTGLNVVEISPHESMALRYDMGMAHLMAGSSERALECFDYVFGIDPSYRDVAQRIDELRGGSERHAP